jgi:hypothetical protein
MGLANLHIVYYQLLITIVQLTVDFLAILNEDSETSLISGN